MKVIDAINVVPNGALVYLGAENGGSFVWIGTKEDAVNEIARLSDAWHSYYTNKIPKLERKNNYYREKIKSLEESTIPALEKYMETHIPDHAITKKYEDAKKSLERLPLQIELGTALISTTKDILNSWIPFLERDVTEAYQRRFIDPGFIIIYEGVENGKYWTLAEYNNDVASKTSRTA